MILVSGSCKPYQPESSSTMGAVWAAGEHLVYSYGHGRIVELACILRNYEAAFETIRIEVSPSSLLKSKVPSAAASAKC
jgi:hypothetical protein